MTIGWFALFLLTSCQASRTTTVTPILPEAKTEAASVTSYPAPIVEPATITPAEAYPAEANPAEAYPGSELNNQIIPTAVDLGVYPIPYPADLTPLSQSQSPGLIPTQPVGITTLIPTPTTLTGLASSTPFGEYPLPDASTPSGDTQTFNPYPGPDNQELTATPLAGETGGTELPGGDSSAQPTATPTPIPGVVRTQLKASDPTEFSLTAGETQLVEFFAFWSPISQSMAPVMYILEDRYQNRIHFFYLDIDDPANNLYKTLLGDRLPPVFFLLDGEGNVLHEWQGYIKAEDFEASFATLFAP